MIGSIIEVRRAFITRGFTPVPVIGKKPVGKEWQKTDNVSETTLATWERNFPGARNTGVLTRRTPTLDIDLLNESAALAGENLTRDRFGGRGRILVRVGRHPKRAIPFRVGAPFKKITTNFVGLRGSDAEKLEFLGDGQQFVAHGIHPDTQAEYVWSGGDPSTVDAADLPEISESEAQELQNDLMAMLIADFGYQVASVRQGNGGTSRQRNKPARKSTARDEIWAGTALNAECELVANAPNGDRNEQLNRSAFNLFQIVWGGALDMEEVRQRLFAAAKACGLTDDTDGEDAVWRTIDGAAEAARSQPRVRPIPTITNPIPNAGSGAGGGLGLATASANFGGGGSSGSSAAGPGAAPAPATRWVIEIKNGDKSEVLDKVERELVDRYGGFGLYQRGGQLVHVTRFEAADADGRATLVWRLAPVEHAHVFEVFTRIIDFQKFDGRRKSLVSVDCPMQLPNMYAARRRWDLPTVLGIVHTPQLRADGSLVDTEGYDPETRLLFKFNGVLFPPVPSCPTKADAEAALKVIEEVIATFPFKTKVDLSVVLSLFLTVLSQRGYGLAPLHAISAPAAGTGKSLLVALAAILATGQTAPVIAQGLDKNEFRKAFATELLSGVPLIAIDNCEQPITGDLLCQAITEENKNIRLFGHLKAAGVGTGTLITATGNNLAIGSDLSRRVLISMLDAGVERPEKRIFKVRIKRLFRERRGELVSALLTVLRAGRLARFEIEELKLEPLGGLEEWCAWVRDPLVWLGRADPTLSIETSYENNVDREAHEGVILAWTDNIGLSTACRVEQLIEQMDRRAGVLGGWQYPELRAALLHVAEDKRSPGNLSTKRLGWWLKAVQGKPIGNLRLVRVRLGPKSRWHWKLETI